MGELIFYPFTTDPDLLKICSACLPIILLYHILDVIQTLLYGAIKALNLQHLAPYISIPAYYLLCLPLVAFLLFSSSPTTDSSLTNQNSLQASFWIGILLALAVQTIAYIIILVGFPGVSRGILGMNEAEKRWEKAVEDG